MKNLVVIGTGLIGGSFALALKSSKTIDRVVGIGRSMQNLARALELGVVDEIGDVTAVQDADLVLVAVPVAQMRSVLASIVPHLTAATLITDAGSTKQDVIAAARQTLGAHFPRFVPAHPIAGGEKSGAESARDDLFEGKNVVLTPLAETDRDAVDQVRDVWLATGARVRDMLPEEHDRVLAAVSHLPHVLAFTLVDYISSKANADILFDFAAGGFRDFTRIAGSSPEMWRDIALANRAALLDEVTDYRRKLAEFERLLGENDGQALQDLFARAQTARNAWLADKGER